jgi:phosphopantothenoylcysteine decarboxylase
MSVPETDGMTTTVVLPKILLCCSGSVASVKIPELVVEISKFATVRVVATTCALHFIERSKEYDQQSWDLFHELGGMELVSIDEHEWLSWDRMGDDVVHIDMCKWADFLVLAPASANMIGKMVNGIADNLVSCVLRSWDNSCKPMLICPAMNTVMWSHPLTKTHLELLLSGGCWSDVIIVQPVAKTLACGDVGIGALAAVSTIVKSLVSLIDERPRWQSLDVRCLPVQMIELEHRWRELSRKSIICGEFHPKSRACRVCHDKTRGKGDGNDGNHSVWTLLGVFTAGSAVGALVAVVALISLLADGSPFDVGGGTCSADL